MSRRSLRALFVLTLPLVANCTEVRTDCPEGARRVGNFCGFASASLDATADRDVGRPDSTSDRPVSVSDVPVAPDAPAGVDVVSPPTDAGAGGLVLRASGMASVAALETTSGSLRLHETGFEVGERSCVGTLCLAGGLTP